MATGQDRLAPTHLPHGNSSPTLTYLRARPAEIYTVFIPALRDAGELTRNEPIEVVTRNLTGQRVCSYFNDYYGRIFVTPQRLDFGAVVGAQQRMFSVWNARLENATITEILESGTGDPQLVGDATPVTLLPMETTNYNVIVDAAGDPEILYFYDIVTATQTIRVTVLALRSRTFLFEPDWNNSVAKTLGFRTDIVTSRTGREQRRALRDTPRRTLEFTLTLLGKEKVQAFTQEITEWQNRIFSLPDYTRFARLAEDADANQAVLTVESIPYWMVEGRPLFLRYDDEVDLVTVDSITGNNITLNSLLIQDIPAGAKLHPVLAGYIQTSQQTASPVNNAMTLAIVFEIDPASETIYPLPEPTLLLDGYEVFDKPPNWAAAPQTTFNRPRETVDFSQGRIAYFTPINFPSRAIQATYLNREIEEADDMSAFYERMRGRAGEFFAPTWQDDLPLNGTQSANTNTLRVIGANLTRVYNDTVHKAIYVKMADGTTYVRRVLSIVEEAGNTRLNLDGVWPIDLTPQNVAFVSWLLRCRFSSDSQIIEAVTDEVSQFQTTYQSIEAL